MQLVTGLLVAYLVIGGGVALLAARGGEVAAWLIVLLVATFLGLVVALAALGQGLWLEGWRAAGRALTGVALLLIVLVVVLAATPGWRSGLMGALGDPYLYAGPVGWLSGCGPTEVPTEPAADMADDAMEEATEDYQEEATEQPSADGDTPVLPTVTPDLYPPRQIFPETLYWQPEVLTDEDGRLTLDLPLADSLTTWRLTALASTQAGDLGVSTYDIVVFQDFSIALDIPPVIEQGQDVHVGVMVYNYSRQAETVQLEPWPDDWYTLQSAPESITVDAGSVGSIAFTIQPEQSGMFTLIVYAQGAEVSDAVSVPVPVQPVP